MSLIDSISDSYQDASANSFTGVGHAFQAPGTYLVTSAKFYVGKLSGSTVGSVYAELYLSTGSYGTDAIPTGGVLATSDSIAITAVPYTFPTFGWVSFTFTGAQQYEISSGTIYVIAVRYPDIDGSNNLYVGTAFDGAAHAGNGSKYNGASWVVFSPFQSDVLFEIYGDAMTKEISTSESVSVSEFKLVDSDPPMGADLIFVADTATVEVSDPALSVYDSPSISESIDLEYVYEIYVSSAISVSEDVTPDLEIKISVSDATSLFESATTIATCISHTRVLPPVKAPVAELDAEGGNRSNLDKKAPVAIAIGQGGSQVVETAPVAELESECTFSTPAELESTSPTASLEGIGGSEEEGTSPVAEIEAESYSNYTELDKNSPTARGEASSYEEQTASLDKKAPFPSIEAEEGGWSASLEAIAPVGYGSDITGFMVIYGTLDTKAPVADILHEDALCHDQSVSLDANAPYATMLTDTGDGDTEQAISSYTDRFEDYTVEYSR